jgi:hypothetical protein
MDIIAIGFFLWSRLLCAQVFAPNMGSPVLRLTMGAGVGIVAAVPCYHLGLMVVYWYFIHSDEPPLHRATRFEFRDLAWVHGRVGYWPPPPRERRARTYLYHIRNFPHDRTAP